MKKFLLTALLSLSSMKAYSVDGSIRASLGVERDGPQLGVDYILPQKTYETYKAYFRYQASGISSGDFATMLGAAAGLHGTWGPYSAYVLPGLSINFIDEQGISVGPSFEVGATYWLDAQMGLGFSKFDNWIWIGEVAGLWNSSFLVNFEYKL